MAKETQAFEVIVSVTGNITNQNVAIAEGVRYLAEGCSDFRETGDPFEIHAYDGHEAGFTEDERLDWGIGIHFVATIEDDEHLKQMMDDLTDMKMVESVEKLMYA